MPIVWSTSKANYSLSARLSTGVVVGFASGFIYACIGRLCDACAQLVYMVAELCLLRISPIAVADLELRAHGDSHKYGIDRNVDDSRLHAASVRAAWKTGFLSH